MLAVALQDAGNCIAGADEDTRRVADPFEQPSLVALRSEFQVDFDQLGQAFIARLEFVGLLRELVGQEPEVFLVELLLWRKRGGGGKAQHLCHDAEDRFRLAPLGKDVGDAAGAGQILGFPLVIVGSVEHDGTPARAGSARNCRTNS